MNNDGFLLTTVAHAVCGRRRTAARAAGGRVDRGALSLEGVLWCVAAGFAAVIVAGIIMSR